ncbi:protein-disulfide reductase DsbD family protein [Acetobacter conturbans]|uniref:Cytochrome C biogenesis protein n=1 Tax=Acetobacter conturbans TaxID=1737472 RepID=A0ABX0K496_9PROT|nr:cytochrome C biogenesis protein [Acetobacter conturbans]
MRLFRTTPYSLLVIIGLTLPVASLFAAESDPVPSDRDTATLVSDSDTVSPDHPLKVGLRLHLQPGWHTYWKNPGDAGEAVILSVMLSGAVSGKADGIEWPAPERLPDGPLMSYGYTGDVLLPVTLHPGASEAESNAATVNAHAEWLVCAAVCVPEQADFRLDLHKGTPAPSMQAPLFAQAAALVPGPSPFPATITPDGTLSLRGNGLSSQAVKEAWFIPDIPGQIDQIAPQPLLLTADTLTLRLKPLDGFPTGKPLTGLLQLRDAAGEKSTLSITASPVAATPDTPPMASGWLTLAALAFLGGLILNLMPCVFPVLAMKALAILRLHDEHSHIRSGMAYTAGILLMFGLLGGLTLAVRHASLSAGWGFQFQSPVFVASIFWVLFAVGLGLLGIFELPVISAGQGALSRQRGLTGDFLTGLLAVLVATPCTAPFMGGAVAGALAAPPVAALGIFLSMGLGLACPYLLFTIIPGAGRLLPRPGRWMEILRQLLAFPVFATCIWLLWVLAQQGGGSPVMLTSIGVLALGFSGWLAVTARGSQGRWSKILLVSSVVMALSPLSLLPLLSSPFVSATAPTGGRPATSDQIFSPERLASLRKDGKPVFIDMTAAWCITCLVNERVTLDSHTVQAAFARGGIVFLKGDWTNRNQEIGVFLHQHGRDGVPLYVYYPPHGEGMILPQILTPQLVLQAIGGN